MTTYVMRNGKIVERGSTDDTGYSAPWVTAVISDTMDQVKHHGSGRIFDSKSRFRAETRAMGMVEIGNEKIKPRQPVKLDKRQRREDIKRAIYELRNR